MDARCRRDSRHRWVQHARRPRPAGLHKPGELWRHAQHTAHGAYVLKGRLIGAYHATCWIHSPRELREKRDGVVLIGSRGPNALKCRVGIEDRIDTRARTRT